MEAQELLDEVRSVIGEQVLMALAQGDADVEALQRVARRARGRLGNDRSKRRPMIVPVVLDV